MMGLYKFLLHLYPASFRAAYGEEMCAIFAGRRHESNGVLALMHCGWRFF